jgi:hypothetical protein
MHGKRLVIGYGYANARGTGHLGLEHEQREVRDALVLGASRLKESGIKPVGATIRIVPAITVTGLSMLVNTRPDILILSMHGAGEPGLCMVGESGELMMVTPEQVTGIFQGTNIPFAILSACHTFAHAENMQRKFKDGGKGLPRWVVGTAKEVSDPGAKGYARTLASVCMTPGITIGRAHRQGLATAESTAPGSKDIINLYCLDPRQQDADNALLYEAQDGSRSSGGDTTVDDLTLEFLNNQDGRIVETERVQTAAVMGVEETAVQRGFVVDESRGRGIGDRGGNRGY